MLTLTQTNRKNCTFIVSKMFPTELGTTFRVKCRIACLSTQNIFSGQLLIGLKNKDKNMLSITDWPGGMTLPETAWPLHPEKNHSVSYKKATRSRMCTISVSFHFGRKG